jgi:hypothetical protein
MTFLSARFLSPVFSKPTSELVRDNIKSSMETTNHLLHFRFRKAFLGDETTETEAEAEADAERGRYT